MARNVKAKQAQPAAETEESALARSLRLSELRYRRLFEAAQDGILLKESKLIETEWAVMKKHPVFAYEMLAPIRYLRSALDIPCSHHEKWDGSGYPLGLKGEQIPLSARIFAVVDVWDALRSDRHYRRSWPLKKVREHLRTLAGTHFDPHVVKVCLASDILRD
ncbi:hypothetical protein GMSM_20400 [Geomonas sp. Red276]